MTLKSEIVTASKWSTLTELVSKAITPIVFIILTRLLLPEEFGVVAVATMIVSFTQIFWDAGLGKTLIQRQKNIDESANIVFWTNILMAAFIYISLFFFADLLARLFGEPQAKKVIQIQGLLILLTAFSSVHIALFQRQLNFKALFYVRVFSNAIPGFATIPMALAGLGYWALVASTLFGGVLQVIMLLHWSKWRPRLTYDRKLAVQLLTFGAWVTGESFLTWVYLWLDSLILGIYLGTHVLGLYRSGSAFVTTVFGLILSPLLPVLFSSFSRMQDDKDRLYDAILKANKIIAMISLPVGCGAWVLQDLIAGAIFPDTWAGISPIIGWLGLANGCAWIVVAYSEVFRSIGRPDINTKIMVTALFFFLPSYLISVRFGFTYFIIVRFLLTFVGIQIHLYYIRKYLKVGLKIILWQSRWSFAAVLGMSLLLYWFDHFGSIPLGVAQQLLLQVFIGIGLYLILLYREWPFMLKITKIVISNKGHDQ